MEIDLKSFSCDIIIEEKFIPDVEDQIIDHHDLQDDKGSDLDQIVQNNHQNEEKNSTENNEKSQNSELSNGQLYKCKCNKRYKTSRMFKQHKKICQFQNSNLIVCRVSRCYATFDNKNDFEEHKLKGHCNKPKIKKGTKSCDTIGHFPCDDEDCTAEFQTKRRLDQHKRRVHTSRRFTCLYCDLTFKGQHNKNRHEQRFHIKRPKSQTKITKKLGKSQEIQIKNSPKIKVKVEKIEKTSAGGRITRSQNKKTNFSNYFEDFDLEKRTENQLESDGDTSATGSFDEGENISVKASSGSDSDENGQVLKVSKREKNDKNQNVMEESNEYLCSVCHESFTKKMDAKIHEKNCQNSKKQNCKRVKVQVKNFEITCEYEDCDDVFTNNIKYNSHINLVHFKIPKNQGNRKRDFNHKGCFLCKKSFRFKKDLDDHMKIPHKINCSKCSRIFVESAQLERHIKYEHLEDLKKLQCSKCPKKFMTEIDIKKHNKVVHDKKMEICPICSNEIYIYTFSQHFKNHKSKGGSGKSFCKSCQVYLGNKTDFEKHKGTELHLKKESDKEEFILPHDINAVDSLLIKRSDEGIFDPVKDKKLSKGRISSCNDCGLKFRNFYLREAHRVKFHGYQKPHFHCTICDMNFSRQGVLNVHVKKSASHKIKEMELKND